jgi:GntR family transcriptional repressor for pyruvate dehydrogenase complex
MPTFHLEPIRRIAIYQEVIERLENLIVTNGLQPGDQLPSDRQLSEQLGVSRASVRMALKVLESYGRVTAQQGSGTFVSNPAQDTTIASLTRGLPYNRDFILKLAPLRNAIDMAVGEEAWPHRTAKNLAHVWDTIQARGKLMREDDERGDLIVSFERALGAICQNELLRRMQSLIHQIWVEAWVKIGKAPGDKMLFHEEHIGLFDCMRRDDIVNFRKLFTAHLDIERLRNSFDRNSKNEAAEAKVPRPQATARMRRPAARAPRSTRSIAQERKRHRPVTRT